jgi:galactokinase
VNDARSQLVAAGMSEYEAARKQVLLDRALVAFQRLSDGGDRVVFPWWVPGRVEFLGKHTDYAGGRSIVCAAERGICVLASPRNDYHLRVHDAVSNETVSCHLADYSSLEAEAKESGSWQTYVRTVAQRMARNFSPLEGADIVIASDLPQAAGMSSSSALVVAIFVALARVNDIKSRDAYRRAIHNCEQLAEYLGTMENGQSFGELAGQSGVGTFGGSEDHTAILCARAGMLMQYAFCPVRLERAISFPPDHVLVVATSGVVAQKTGAARDRYNSLSTMVIEILDGWASATGDRFPTMAAAIDASPGGVEDLRQLLRAEATGAVGTKESAKPNAHSMKRLARFEQFLLESNELIPAAADALAELDLASLGRIVDRSQEAAEKLLGNQIPETSFLAREARQLGAVAASAFGAGFGGSVWALVPEVDAAGFATRWADAYAERFPIAAERSEILTTHAGPGVIELT